MPTKAARTVGPPEGAGAPINQAREAHHTARPRDLKGDAELGLTFPLEWIDIQSLARDGF